MSTFTPAQRDAINARGNVLVSAGAGTGKTRTVVERCLRLIDEGCSLENILMVTFTEAAAAEMRARLRKALEEKLNCRRDESHESHPDRTETRGAGPSNEKLEEQLALLDTVHISTLHSFCLELVRDHFHELHIDPQVSVLDETQAAALMRETLDELFTQCYRGEFDFAAEVRELIRKYGGGSDERIRALVSTLYRYTQSLPPSARWLERELEHLAALAPERWCKWLSESFSEWRDEWLPVLMECEPCDNISSCIEALRKLPPQPTVDDIRVSMECLHVADVERDWPKGRKTELRKPVAKFFDEALFFRSLVTSRDGRDPLRDDWDWMREPMRALLLLAGKFTEEFTQAKRAQGVVDFADLEQLALQLLVDACGQPTETARAWQRKFEHVFVDECQDMNAAQDAIIRAVSRGEGNRFLVGDVKQSIYRFRLADPHIFRRYEEEWRSAQGGQRIPLADNFRSRERILQFINPLFAALMCPNIGGVCYDADARLQFGNPTERAPLSANANTAPRVELHVLHKTKGDNDGSEATENVNEETNGDEPSARVEDVLAIEKEARLVARRLRELRESGDEIWDEDERRMRRAEWRDMVVLLRSPFDAPHSPFVFIPDLVT